MQSNKAGLDRAEYHLSKGNFDLAFQIVQRLEKNENLTLDERTRFFLLKSALLIKKGHYEPALTFVEQILHETQNIKPCLYLDAYISKIEILWRLGKFDESLNVLMQGEEYIPSLPKKPLAKVEVRKASLLYHKGTIYRLKGNLDQALEYHQKALTIQNKLGKKQDIAASLNCIGIIYDLKGDLNQALEYHQRSLVLRQEIGNKHLIALSLHNIGVIYLLKGNLNQALKHYEDSLVLFEETGNKELIGSSLTNIGIVYRQKGELDQALEYYQRSLTLREPTGNKQEIMRLLSNIGIIYAQKGELNQALEYYQKSLELQMEIGHNIDISITLLQIITAHLDNNSLGRAKEFLRQLQYINNQEKNKTISQRTRLAEALILRASSQSGDWDKAKIFLNQIVEEEIVDNNLTMSALFDLCDMLLDKAEMVNDQKEDLKKVQNHINRLFTFARQQESHSLMAGTYVLKAKLAFIELQHSQTFEKGQELKQYLQQAQKLAQEKNLFFLLVRGQMLLALFYSSRKLFEKAKAEIQEASLLIEEKNITKEKQTLNEIYQKIKSSEAEYLEVLAHTVESGKEQVEMEVLQREFEHSLDNYLKIIRAILASSR
ncbi:MAG: tetratricopeptide repeat protein [Candidatus Hodarchaeota archaeon]